MTAPLLRVEGLVKAFHGNRAVDDVSFDVPAGRIVALLGENGAGKSTVIKMLAGVYQRDAGRILLDGTELAGLPAAHVERLFVVLRRLREPAAPRGELTLMLADADADADADVGGAEQ